MVSEVDNDDFGPDAPASVVAAVAAEMSNTKLPELSEEQKIARQIEREIWHEQQEWLSEQRHRERERQQAEAEAVARHEAAIALAEENKRMRLERQEKIARQVHQQEIANLQFRVRSNEAWQAGVQRAVRNTIAAQQQTTLMSELDAMIAGQKPQPEPEPEQVVYVEAAEGSDQLGDRDFSADAWMKKPRSWW